MSVRADITERTSGIQLRSQSHRPEVSKAPWPQPKLASYSSMPPLAGGESPIGSPQARPHRPVAPATSAPWVRSSIMLKSVFPVPREPPVQLSRARSPPTVASTEV